MPTANVAPEDDYASKQDADHLVSAQEIKQNPDRHKKAMAHIKKRHAAHKAIVDEAKQTKSLHTKVSKGLQNAFGQHDAAAEKNSAGDGRED